MSTEAELEYQSTKTYQHSAGFSCVFRQWKAESHCRMLHGYALKIELTFEAELDERNWVVDFGGLKDIKDMLVLLFDHTLIIAEDDPEREFLESMHNRIASIRILPAVGCEKFAEFIFRSIEKAHAIGPKLMSVQVWEHEANSAKVIRKPDFVTTAQVDGARFANATGLILNG